MVMDMTKGKPMKLLIRFAIPMMIGNLFQQLYNLVDTAVVGRCISSDALAAVGTTGNVIFFLSTVIMGMCNGAGVTIAQYWGSKRYEDMNRSVAALVKIEEVLIVVVSVIGTVFAPSILRLIQVPEEILGDSVQYLRICASMLVFSAAFNASGALLRSVGDSKTPLYAMIVASFTNISLNLVFVLVFHMGVAGVAYATVIAQLFSALICIVHIYRHREQLHLSRKYLHSDRSMIRILLRMGVPTALQSSMISLGGMSVQGLVNTFGTTVMAAYTTVLRIDSVTIQIITSIGAAMSVFTGQNIGTGNFERIRDGLRKTLFLMVTSSVVLAMLVLCFRLPILSIFLNPSTDSASIAYGSQYLSIIGIAYMIAGVMNSYLNVIRGSGDVGVTVVTGLSELAGRIIFAYTLTIPFGVWGIWLATPLSWACGCIIPVVRYYSGRWKSKSLVRDNA